MKDSALPRLDVFEGLDKWGEIRLTPVHLDNLIHVELRRKGTEEWKPLFSLIAVGGRVLFRLNAEHNTRVVAYDPSTQQFSDVAGSATHGDRKA